MTDAPTPAVSGLRGRFDRGSVVPLLADWLCVLVFVALGKENHGESGGAVWYLTVWWPLAVGVVVGGLVTRLYTEDDDWPSRLFGTVAIAVIVGGPLRWLTGRPMFSTFSLVAIAMLSLFTFGWRLARNAVQHRRRVATP